MRSFLEAIDYRNHLGFNPSTRRTVLVAEHDPIVRNILESWTQRQKYRMLAADNGVDAWKLLQQDDNPKPAILNCEIPGMGGLDLCRKIRKRESSACTYVLLLTAKDHKEDRVNGFKAGADDCLMKPFGVDELRARVRAATRILELQDALIFAHDALQFGATHDPLTNVLNREAILDVLQREVERRYRTRDSLGVILLDLDFFKEINDTHGHLIGDVILKEASRRLSLAVRSYDSVGRYSGEEFLAVIPGCDLSNLIVAAERLRHCMADRPIETIVGPICVTLSVGLTSAVGNELCDTESLSRTADKALYRAKMAGRNRVEMAVVSAAVKTEL